MQKLNVLHVASFKGNIGDNANHTGFRNSFKRHLKVEIEYTNFEIREVFWKQKSFNEDFVKLSNTHDLVVIGGGNYFELWVESSQTGTSIDISLDLLKKINVPIIFNALGVDPAQGVKPESLSKFKKFLDVVIESPHMMLSCRNDGSMKTLDTLVGKKYADAFYHVPDAGFFTEVKDSYHPELDPDKKNIVIQIAGDMLDTRFSQSKKDEVSYEDFLDLMVRYIEKIKELNVNFIFVPHIFRDIGVIDELINRLPDSIRRDCVAVAPYLIGQKGQDYIFDLYQKADLVLGMRFHASVCGLGLGKQCIGLVNYPQIDELYSEMNLEEFKVDVRKKGFDKKLYDLSKQLINKETKIPENILDPWKEKLDKFHSDLRVWLKKLTVLS